jgi:hypothetical protein
MPPLMCAELLPTTKILNLFAHTLISISPPRIVSPPSVQLSFYVANDHGKNKLGVVSRDTTSGTVQKDSFYLMIPQQGHHLSPFIGTGDVTFCSEESGCTIVAEGLHFPNGLTLGRDGLIYVPSSMFGTIDVFKPAPNKRLQRVDQIKTGFSIDNVSADRMGSSSSRHSPRVLVVLEAYNDPWNHRAPAAGLRIQQSENGFHGSYILDRVIEDGFGEVLPAATTVVHDVQTGRLFFSSKSSEEPSAPVLPFSDISHRRDIAMDKRLRTERLIAVPSSPNDGVQEVEISRDSIPRT